MIMHPRTTLAARAKCQTVWLFVLDVRKRCSLKVCSIHTTYSEIKRDTLAAKLAISCIWLECAQFVTFLLNKCLSATTGPIPAKVLSCGACVCHATHGRPTMLEQIGFAHEVVQADSQETCGQQQ